MGTTQDTDRFGKTGTSAERQESKVLMDALAARKAELGADAQLPPTDHALSERILGEARRRSEQISASRNPVVSSGTSAQAEKVPLWIWLAWIVALAATAAAFRFLL